MRIRPFFAWYDFWVGAFYDRQKKRLYVMPIPCLGFWIEKKVRSHAAEFAAEQDYYANSRDGTYRSLIRYEVVDLNATPEQDVK